MPSHIEWNDIAWRLFLTVVAGTLIGIDRRQHGRPAGLRSTLLVCLAASVSMIAVNLLLPVSSKAPGSHVMMDLMRLPLGILSGMGFICAGVILRKDSLVLGVTTTATLWFVTIIGLCFGGGQLVLGLVALALGLIVLWVLKPDEDSWKQERQASLTVVVGSSGPNEQDITKAIVAAGYQVSSLSVVYEGGAALREMGYQVKWRSRIDEVQPPTFVAELATRENTLKVVWRS
jgi:putative Mg2+ transporter-C (MgtC) family protein